MARRSERAQASSEVENYPYDPCALKSELTDLDRLRAIPDRQLARYLFELYRSLQRPSVSQVVPSQGATPEKLLAVAKRALAGEAGRELREVAEYLFLDDRGQPSFGKGSLENFGIAMARLKQSA